MKFFEKDATYHQVYITPDLKPDVVQLVIEASMDKFMHNFLSQKHQNCSFCWTICTLQNVIAMTSSLY